MHHQLFIPQLTGIRALFLRGEGIRHRWLRAILTPGEHGSSICVGHLVVVAANAGTRFAALTAAALPVHVLDLGVLVERGLTCVFLIMALTLHLFFHRAMLLDQLVYFGFPQRIKVRVSQAVHRSQPLIRVKC